MKLQQQLAFLREAARNFPGPQRAEEALALVFSGHPFDWLFFSEISDPAWITVLNLHGVFRKVPEPIKHEDGSTSFPRPLSLQGLTRLAPKAPEAAAKIIENYPKSDNIMVGDQLMRCILSVGDARQVPRLLPIATELILTGGNSARLFLRDVLKSWVDLGSWQEALQLLSSFIQTIARSEPGPRRDQQSVWELGECDREILATLAETHPLEVTCLCLRCLREFYETYHNRSRKSDQDIDQTPESAMDDSLSFYLEDFRQTGLRRDNPVSILAHRLYSALLPIYRADTPERDKQDGILSAQPGQLFRRLRCQLYADVPEHTLGYARREVMANADKMNQSGYRHDYEFATMLEKHAANHGHNFLSEEETAKIVSKVLEGPLNQDGELEQDTRYQSYFWRHQLWPIRSLLAADLREQLDKWTETQAGRRKTPDLEDYKPIRLIGRSGFVRDRSPYTLEQLAAFTDEELWRQLNSWKKSKEWIEEDDFVEESSRELARTFTELLTTQADRFSSTSEWWKNLHRPVMLSVPLEAWAKSLNPDKEEGASDAAPVDLVSAFGVMDHIVSFSQNPHAEEPATEHSTEDPDRKQARLATARFLKAFVRQQPAPNAWSSKVEELLGSLIRGPEERLDRLERSERHDWQSEAINSVRGEAWEALLSLALKERNQPNPGEGNPSPWIHGLLSERLKPETSESPAIYSLLGSQLRIVAYAFPNWIQEHRDLLFPVGRPECLAALTDGHLAYDQPHRIVVERLPEFLSLALEVAERRLKSKQEDESAGAAVREVYPRLGFHIAFYYWNNWFPDPEAGLRLFDRFLLTATSATRAETLGNIGTAFEKAKPTAETEFIFDRAQALISRWLEYVREKATTAAAGSLDAELGQFADLIAAECFPLNWRVDTASTALKLITRPRWSFQLLDTLEEWSEHNEEQPERIAAGIFLLSCLTENLSDELRWSIQVKRLIPVLQKGLANPSEVTRAQTNQVIENLLRHGFFELLDLDFETDQTSL